MRDLIFCWMLVWSAVFLPPAAPGASDTSREGPMRFPVAHKHSFSWCYGYLDVTTDTVRFEVVHPQNDQGHAFEVRLDAQTARQWTVLGAPQPGIEVRVGTTTQVFVWLANEAEVRTAPAWRPAPPQALPPARLLAALHGDFGSNGSASANPPPNLSSTSSPQPDLSGVGDPSRDPATVAAGLGTSAPTSPRPSLEGSSARNSLEGLYVGFRAGYATYLSMAPTTLDRALVYFYPEGLFITVDPDSGPPGPDSRSEFPRAHPNSKGHYSIDDQGSVVLSYEGGDRKLVTINGNGQQPGMERFIPLCTCDNLRFSGTFRMNNHVITFAPDGNFIDRGVMFDLLEARARVLPPALRAPGSGVYHVVRNRLILQYQDGHTSTAFFSAPNAQAASPPWILLGLSMLGRVGG